MRQRRLAVSLCALALCLSANAETASNAGTAHTPQSGRVDDSGVSVRWTYRPASDAPEDRGLGALDLRIDDTATGQPLRYAPRQLAAWLQRGRQALSDAELSCPDKVRALASQGIGRRAEIDLNGWRLLTFNADRSIAFINPSVGLNNAKLESIVTMPGDIDAWTNDAARLRIWVHASDGEHGHLLSVDTQRRRIARRFEAPAGPSEVVVDEDGAHVWVAGRAAHRLWVVGSTAEGAKPSAVEVPGLKGAIAAPNGGLLAFTDCRPSLSLWRAAGEGRPPRSERQWSLPAAPVAARWSAQTQRIVVALRDGRIASIDPKARRSVPDRMMPTAEHGVQFDAMELFDGGRYALWVDAGHGRAGVVDLASGRSFASTAVIGRPDGIVFTDGFAYVHDTATARASLLSLADLRNGNVKPVDVSLGTAQRAASAGVSVAPDPDGHGVLVASAVDGVVYQYSEGMMAPIGSFSNYRRSALGVMVLDTSLTEVGPGRYRAMLRNERGGAHELVLSGVGPRMAVCAAVSLPTPSDALAAPVEAPRTTAALERIESVAGGGPSLVGGVTTLSGALSGALTSAPASAQSSARSSALSSEVTVRLREGAPVASSTQAGRVDANLKDADRSVT
ncbi:MAG: hypothetical protein JWQ11_2817, partial [Rhizobacter sp.]|nr:hypothetical protein [Rhizobacter sp.]